CRLHGDVGELLRVRVRVDRAVAVDQYLVGQAHEEHRGDDRGVRGGLDDLEGGPDGRRGGVHGPGHHAGGQALLHHQGAEVVHVGDDVVGQFLGDAAVRAQGRVPGGERLTQFGDGRVDQLGVAEVDAEV